MHQQITIIKSLYRYKDYVRKSIKKLLLNYNKNIG